MTTDLTLFRHLYWAVAREPLPAGILDVLGDLHWSEVFRRDERPQDLTE